MLKCIFVGDVMPGAARFAESPDLSILKDLGESDIVLGNLESPLVVHTPSKINLKKIPLWTSAGNTDVLEKFHFTHFCINNNHTYDLYEKGLDETINILTQLDIKPFGLNYGVVSQFHIIEKDHLTLGVFAVNWVQSQFNRHLFNDLKEINIKKLKKNVDFLICFLHWGDDHNVFINREQQETARKLIDQGVDLIIGSHPHVPQGWENYKGKYVFYSLGNFIFTPKESYAYLPYHIRYDDHRENVLFQRLECKMGLYVKVVFSKAGYSVIEVNAVYREHTLPAQLPGHLRPFYEGLLRQINKQVSSSNYTENESEKRRILTSYTLPFIFKHPLYWAIFFKKIRLRKVFSFLKTRSIQ